MVKKLMTVIAFAILLMGVIAYSRNRMRARIQPQLKSGFTIAYNLSHNGRLYAFSVRYTKSSGEFLEQTNYVKPDGSFDRQTKLAGTIAQGAVLIDNINHKLKLAGRPVLLHETNEAEIKAAGPFDREDWLLGYKVIVQRSCPEQNHCAEYWRAPALGGAPLKFDLTEPDGTRRTQEATAVILGEPSFIVPDYPVDNSIQDRLEKMRQSRPLASPR